MPVQDRAALIGFVFVLCLITLYEITVLLLWGRDGLLSRRCYLATEDHWWLPLVVLLGFSVIYLHCFFRIPF